jgi:hypothetical protein
MKRKEAHVQAVAGLDAPGEPLLCHVRGFDRYAGHIRRLSPMASVVLRGLRVSRWSRPKQS